MRLDQLEQHLKQRRPVAEANVAAKIKDPKTIKMLGIAMRHDGTLPKSSIAKLGPKPDDESILALWSTMLDKSLSKGGPWKSLTVQKALEQGVFLA